MKRYEITSEFKEKIINSPYSLTKMHDLLGFNVKHILYENKSISEEHLKKLNSFLDISLFLKEVKLDPSKNLGKYSFTQPIKSIKKSEDLAEFIGIMLGDGNIFRNAITIAFNKKDEIYINYVEKLSREISGINFKKKTQKGKNTAYLYCYNKNLTEELIKLGLKRGNKIKNQIGIPNWIKKNRVYSKFCLRGLIDTDGCVYFCKRDKQIYIKFTNYNAQLLRDFKECAFNLEYSFAKANSKNICLYRKKEVARFINEIKPLKSVNGAMG